MTDTVDSYRFTDAITKRLVKAWIKLEPRRDIPWTALKTPLSECSVALISSAAIALKTDKPFDQEGERRNPWWGDPTYRVIPDTAQSGDIRVWHMHIDPRPAESDMNCLLPLQRLRELVVAGRAGRAAPSHYSFMGYQLDPTVLLESTMPSIIERLRSDRVDLAVLIPA